MRQEVRRFYELAAGDYRPLTGLDDDDGDDDFAPLQGPNAAIENLTLSMCGLMTADAKARAIAMGDATADAAGADAMAAGAAGLQSAMQSAQSGADTGTALTNAALAMGTAVIKQATSGSGSSSSSSSGSTSTSVKIYDQMWDGTAKGIAKLTASADGLKTAAFVQGMARKILRDKDAKTKGLSTFNLLSADGKASRLFVNATQLAKLQALQTTLGRTPTPAEAATALGFKTGFRGTAAAPGAKTTSGAATSSGASLPLLAALGGAALLAAKFAGAGG